MHDICESQAHTRGKKTKIIDEHLIRIKCLDKSSVKRAGAGRQVKQAVHIKKNREMRTRKVTPTGSLYRHRRRYSAACISRNKSKRTCSQ